jgi:DNA-binding winged helix-turn-helix (wHTH) protein/tetratricopeptide (TPR) repeat protein
MSLTTSPNFLYAFGPFVLDVREAQLRRDGVPVPLPPKSFEVLAVLVRQAGALVDKDALMREVWPDTFIEEANLARHVWTVRKALGDDGGGARYIETVSKRGYRFAAEVTADAAPAPRSALRARLLVLPFRWLTPESELDFLAFSLPDAIVSALSSVESLTVRSSLVAARFAGDPPDLERIARDAQVTSVVAGTLLRAGDRIRVTTQLVSAPAGTVLSTATSEAPITDLFLLQDALVSRIVESLAGPLAARDMVSDVPASGRTYEWYLRANRMAQDPATFDAALELYRSCVETDAGFAPAWARLGRLYRVMAKYTGNQRQRLPIAEDTLRRALSLNPELSIAHNQLAYLEVDLGRATDAMVRLLGRLRRQRHEAELYAGLVHACRYCGLLDVSIAAHHRAIALDPLVATSVVQSYWMRGDVELALAESAKLSGGSLRALLLAATGRDAEAIALLKSNEARMPQFLIRQFSVALRTLLEGDRVACLAAIGHIEHADYADPEGIFLLARYLARLGELPRAQAAIEASVEQGFMAGALLESDPWLSPLRGSPGFVRVVARAEARRQDALAAFVDAGGPELVG